MIVAAWIALAALIGVVLGAWAAYQIGREHGYEQHQRETQEIRRLEEAERVSSFQEGWKQTARQVVAYLDRK